MFLYKIIGVSNIDIGNKSRPANHNNYHRLYLSRKGKETKFLKISYWFKMTKNENICDKCHATRKMQYFPSLFFYNGVTLSLGRNNVRLLFGRSGNFIDGDA